MTKPVQVTVEPERIALRPGESADVEVTIQNASPVVEHFATSVLGLPSNDLFSCEPEVVKLRPREIGNVRVRISLPEKGGMVAGPYTLGVLVRSPYQREVSRCEELPLDVQPAPELIMTVQPEVASGGKLGNYNVNVANQGNTPLAVTLAGGDQENRVGFDIRPRELRLEPGMSGGAQVVARTAQPWTGQDVRRPMTLRAHAGDLLVERPVSFVQRPRIRGGLMKFGGITAALALLSGAAIGGAMLIRGAKDETPPPTPAAQSQGPNNNQPTGGANPTTGGEQPTNPANPTTQQPSNPANPTTGQPPSQSNNPNQPKTAVFMDFADDAQKTGERGISNDRYKDAGFLLDTPTEKAPPGCENANAQALRISRASGFGGFLSSATPTNAAACNTMPIRFDFLRPARNVNVGFAGAGADYQLIIQLMDGQTEVRTAKSVPGTVTSIPFEAPAGKAIKSVTFWHVNPDPRAKDFTVVKSIGHTPA